jgi:diketogulonate reductase-like aldo/keto reductase
MQRKIEKSELVTRNNGVRKPALGFGVFQTPPDVTAAAFAEA